MKRTILILAILIGGCGSGNETGHGWKPAGYNVGVFSDYSTYDAGVYMNSDRRGSRLYQVATGRGVFHTYTSSALPARTPVVMVVYKDKSTRKTTATSLDGGSEHLLVRDVAVFMY